MSDPLFILFVVGFLARCFIANDLLDRFYAYDTPGGSPLLKVHPGSYVLFVTAIWACLRPTHRANVGLLLPAGLLALVAAIGLSWTLVTQNTTAIGALFDLYLVAAAGLFTFSRFSEVQKRRLFAVILGMLAVNAVLLVVEFALQRRLVSLVVATTGGVFRPAGLLGHPLVNGLCYAVLAPLTIRLKAPLAVRVALSGLVVAIVLISGARFASLIAVVMLPVTTLMALRAEPGRHGLQQGAVWLQLVLMAMGLPVLVIAAMAGGLGYRFTNSLIDQSSLKRINDFMLLNYLTPHEWWFGGSIGALQNWSKVLFNGDSIESPIVIGIFIYGLPMAVVLLVLAFGAIGVLALRSAVVERLSLAAFLFAVSSGNGLMVKGSVVLFAVVVVAAAGGGTLMHAARLPVRWRTFRAPPPVARWRAPGAAPPSKLS